MEGPSAKRARTEDRDYDGEIVYWHGEEFQLHVVSIPWLRYNGREEEAEVTSKVLDVFKQVAKRDMLGVLAVYPDEQRHEFDPDDLVLVTSFDFAQVAVPMQEVTSGNVKVVVREALRIQFED